MTLDQAQANLTTASARYAAASKADADAKATLDARNADLVNAVKHMAEDVGKAAGGDLGAMVDISGAQYAVADAGKAVHAADLQHQATMAAFETAAAAWMAAEQQLNATLITQPKGPAHMATVILPVSVNPVHAVATQAAAAGMTPKQFVFSAMAVGAAPPPVTPHNPQGGRTFMGIPLIDLAAAGAVLGGLGYVFRSKLGL